MDCILNMHNEFSHAQEQNKQANLWNTNILCQGMTLEVRRFDKDLNTIPIKTIYGWLVKLQGLTIISMFSWNVSRVAHN